MTALTDSRNLVIIALLAAGLVLWQRGNVHKNKRAINAAWMHHWRDVARDAEAIINAPCPGCGEIPVTAQAAAAEVGRIEAERAQDEIAELERWWAQ